MLEVVPVVSQTDDAEGEDRARRKRDAGKKIIAPVPAKLPTLKRTPPRYRLDQEYGGLVWDHEYAFRKLSEKGDHTPYQWRTQRWERPYVLIYQPSKRFLTFWAAPLSWDGQIGKLTVISIYDGREALAVCRNLTDHLTDRSN